MPQIWNSLLSLLIYHSNVQTNKISVIMKARVCYLFFLLLFATNSMADINSTSDNQYECIYEFKINNGNPPEVYSTILTFNENSSFFSDYSIYLIDSLLQVQHSEEEYESVKNLMRKKEYFFDQTITLNLADREYLVCGSITPDNYYYIEEASKISWNLTDESDTICGYLCEKAIGEYGGRSWSVWYTSQIPAMYGPWKLCGVPGLVLKAEDADSIFVFEAISFRKSSVAMPPLNTDKHIKTTREKFIRQKNNFEKNPVGNISFESIGSINIDKQGKGSVLIDGQQLRFHPNGYVPLEKQ